MHITANLRGLPCSELACLAVKQNVMCRWAHIVTGKLKAICCNQASLFSSFVLYGVVMWSGWERVRGVIGVQGDKGQAGRLTGSELRKGEEKRKE